jgi:hypothetical protein
MKLRPGKLILILLIPALVYGALKGIMYYNAKSTVDEFVKTASAQADIRYSDISTDLRGAVTISGISIQPLGFEDTIGVDSLRFASDDPLFFVRGSKFLPGEVTLPNSLSYSVSGIQLPLSSDIFTGAGKEIGADPCTQGLDIQPELLKKIGFSELAVDLDGSYRLDETSRTLEIGINMDLHDIESMQLDATMNDVDIETLSQGGAPQFSLGRMSFSVRVSPEFGRQALKACAMGSDATVQEWSGILAEQVLAQMEQQGLSLGTGLSNAVREFYRDWGEFEIVAAPAQPVGLLSLMFLPPDQLADTLSLQMSLNNRPITDTSFRLQQPEGKGLAALFGGEQQGTGAGGAKTRNQPRRILVKRSYESVPVAQIGNYVGQQVQLKPRGQPMREGLLHAIGDGEVEVRQTLHGGKYSGHVALKEIESLKVLVRHEVSQAQ